MIYPTYAAESRIALNANKHGETEKMTVLRFKVSLRLTLLMENPRAKFLQAWADMPTADLLWLVKVPLKCQSVRKACGVVKMGSSVDSGDYGLKEFVIFCAHAHVSN